MRVSRYAKNPYATKEPIAAAWKTPARLGDPRTVRARDGQTKHGQSGRATKKRDDLERVNQPRHAVAMKKLRQLRVKASQPCLLADLVGQVDEERARGSRDQKPRQQGCAKATGAGDVMLSCLDQTEVQTVASIQASSSSQKVR